MRSFLATLLAVASLPDGAAGDAAVIDVLAEWCRGALAKGAG